jgi:hypothetical protein
MQTPQLYDHQKQEKADRQVRYQEVLPGLPSAHGSSGVQGILMARAGQ